MKTEMQYDELVSAALDIGEDMLRTGGEVSRVEDTIGRILRAYEFQRVDVFSITSEIQVTAVSRDGSVHNQQRRIHEWGTDLERLEDLNQISRDICRDRPSPGTVHSMLESAKSGEIREKERNPARELLTAYLGGIFASSGFTIFFGGNLTDALLTAVLACLITWMSRHTSYRSENRLLYYFFFSVITGLLGAMLAELCSAAGIKTDLDKVLIGCVMLTIPGIAITYSVRDMLLGDTITGMLRFAESILTAAAIAGGYIFSSMFAGGIAGWMH